MQHSENADDEERIASMVACSVKQSLKARFGALSTAVARDDRKSTIYDKWRLQDCIAVDDANKHYATNKTYTFAVDVDPRDPTEFVADVREQPFSSKEQRRNTDRPGNDSECGEEDGARSQEYVAELHSLTRVVAEVLADNRHFCHIATLFSGVFVSANYCNVCKFTTKVASKRILLLNFDLTTRFSLAVSSSSSSSSFSSLSSPPTTTCEKNHKSEKKTLLSRFSRSKK